MLSYLSFYLLIKDCDPYSEGVHDHHYVYMGLTEF